MKYFDYHVTKMVSEIKESTIREQTGWRVDQFKRVLWHLDKHKD
jgi:hypothetical protein